MQVFLVAALLLVCTVASSQEPTPAPSKSSDAQQNKSGASTHPATENKSNAKLPTIVVNIAQPPDTEEQQRDKRRERDEKTSLEWGGSIWTLVIALFTIASTIALWWETRKSSGAALKAANVAERSLVDLERPYVFADLHEPIFDQVVVAAGRPQMNFVRSRTPVKYGLINRGRSPAFLTDFYQRLVSGGIPGPVDSSDPDLEGVVSLKGQDVGADPHPCRIDFVAGEMDLDALYLIGFIRYTDIFRRQHLTGFCAKYSIVENRFALIGGEEYNYTKDEDDGNT